ncbi:MAG TPA: sodium:solute symporter [Candidatus Limadaptatus stercorigallinarum]|uniref:Sodium:solute symporter n=1 Tax=Candidatus Limadaptatus stercorigallinarum TaxID=2840845 RepID=A0A9D1HS38_9FIRM|nr:sodium:solute symporter [Candidatus Limadaptatus stercorigallinarum]
MPSLISAAGGEVWPQWLIFGVYMAVILAVALITRRKSTSVEGFMFANKGVGGWLSAFAYGATYFSAVVFVGYAGKFGWNFGLSAVWIGIGNMIIGTLAAWLVLANRTKVMTAKLGARTMPEFFEKRYESKYIKLFAALTIFVFLLPYSASVYQGMGYIFEAALGIDSMWCILILAALTAAYLFLGGYLATTITDFIQGLIMIVGIVVTVFMLLDLPQMNWGEGLGALFADPDLTLIPNPVTPEGGTFLDNQLFNIIILVCLTSFGMWGMPQSIHKFYAIKDKAAIRKGAVISTVFSAIVGCGAYFMGSMITRFVSEVPDGNFDRLVPTMLVENLPSALLGLIIVLLFSASMSTLAALSLSSSSTVTVDFYKGYVRKTAPESNLNILIRVLCLVFVAVSAVLAIVEIDAIVSMMSLSWGAIAGCFMGPYVYGLYSKKANKAGAYASIIFSLLLTFALIVGLGYFSLRSDGLDPAFGEAFKAGIGQSPFIGVVTMAASMIVTPVASLIFSRKCAVSRELLDSIFPAALPKHLVYSRAAKQD